ncbi:MAG: MFS transporter [Clostridiales bacterium]|jgi:fucose permease|nr:MFS transporter [Clostridiales bacterium]
MLALLVIIYLAFINLGLPDSILGAAWPVMHADIGAPLSFAGVVSVIVCGGTIVSSLSSNRIISRFGTGKVVAVSVSLTAAALLGVSFSRSLPVVCLLAVPLGLGAGSVDAALNNFVSLRYKARHMSWLHCFWGVGATAGPVIISGFMTAGGGWRGGYRLVSIIQFVMVLIIILSFPLWKKAGAEVGAEAGAAILPPVTNRRAIGKKGVKFAMLAFLCYCGYELSAGLWAASYFVGQKGLSAETAANWAAFYYGGITLGRLVSGFAAAKLRERALIRIGFGISLTGIAVMLLPLPPFFSLSGFVLLGLGSAPFFPMMIHLTPFRFGKEYSQAVMGLQMAAAYVGSTFVPPLIGLLSDAFSLAVLPWSILIMAVGALIFCEITDKKRLREI